MFMLCYNIKTNKRGIFSLWSATSNFTTTLLKTGKDLKSLAFLHSLANKALKDFTIKETPNHSAGIDIHAA